MRKFLPLIISMAFLWPYRVVELFLPKVDNNTTIPTADPQTSLASCGTCPEILGLTIEACGFDNDNEYIIFLSGGGFSVSDLVVDLDPNNNGIVGSGNEDPGTGTCSFTTPSSSLISSLQALAPCVTAAEDGDDIPCCAVVIAYMDVSGPTQIDDMSYICGLGFDIYVLQNSCNRSLGAFSNFNSGCGGNCNRIYAITTPGCSDAVGYAQNFIPSAPSGHVLLDELGATESSNSVCQQDFSFLSFPSPPSLPVIDATVSGISCNGAMDGSITLNVTGGTSPYCYDWDHIPGNTCPTTSEASVISGLGAGDYTVTVTDDSGCMDIATFSIKEPDPLLVFFNPSGTTCAGEPSGAVFILVTGGVPDTIQCSGFDTYIYQYDWDFDPVPGNEVFDVDGPCVDMSGPDGLDDRDLNNLEAGLYNLTVTDYNGCQFIGSIVIDENAAEIVANYVIDSIDCYGETTSINLSISGGLTQDWLFDWSNDGLGDMDDPEDLNNVPAGTYYLHVLEQSTNCTFIDTIVIGQPDQLSISVSGSDATCNGDADGSFTITVNGGTGPFDYIAGPYSGNNLSSPITVPTVGAGSYTVTVTDDNGCTATDIVSINEPDPIDVFFNPSGTTCAGEPSGAVFILVTGGVPDTILCSGFDTYVYQYDWDFTGTPGNDVFDVDGPCSDFSGPDGLDDRDLNDLYAGIYNLTVTDFNGCTWVGSIQIDENAAEIVATYVIDSIECFGETTSIDLSVGGGLTQDWAFDWSNDGLGDMDDPEDLNNIGAGTYILIITEQTTGCVFSDTITIGQPPELVVTATGNTAVCGGLPSGSYVLNISGGTGPYDYVDNAAPPHSGNNVPAGMTTVSMVSAGTYSITVTDDNGCTDVTTVMIDEADTLSAEVFANPIICFDGTTDVWVVPDGGTAPFCYEWNPGPGNCPGAGGPATLTNVTAGTYNVTVMDANNCMVVAGITVTEPPLIETMFSDNFCENTSYTLPDGSSTTTGGTHGPFTLTAANGCDSMVTVDLTSLPVSMNDIMDSFCDSDTYTLPDGSTTTMGGNYGPFTFTAGNGCDSIVNVALTLLPEVTNNITDDFCQNDTYTLPDGSTTTMGGNYGPFTFTAGNGCDSIVNVSLTLLPEVTNNITDDFCENDSYTLPDGSTTNAGGNYGPYTFTAGNGCDSIVNVALTMLPEATNNITDDFCENDSYTLPDGSTTSTGGNFGPYTFTAGNGCDSIVNVALTMLPEVTNDITDDFCENETYTLPDGSTTSTAGNFGPFTFTAGNGCDSIVNVSLTMLPEVTNNITDDFCENDTYTLPDGSTTSAGGNFGPFTFTAGNGCDSIVNVSLTLLPEAQNDIVDQFCENTTYTLPDGSTTMSGGSYGPFTFTAANGCDSIVTVDLTEVPEVINNIVDDFCENDTYTLPDGSSTSTGGNFGPYTFTAGNGCDSIVNVNLTMLPEITNDLVDDFCENDSYTLPDGSSTGIGGNYGPFTFTAGNGCDSVVNVSLTMLPESVNDITDDFCENDSYTLPDGSTTSAGGNYGPFTFTAANGCDSIVNVSLTMLPESVNDITDDFCENDTYTLPDGSTTSAGGNYGPFTFTAGNGCDSIVNVALTMLPEAQNDIVDQFCENTTYVLPDGSTTMAGGLYGPFTFTAANGCDSVVTVDLTEVPEVVNNIIDDFCENDTYTLPDGSTTSAGGNYGPFTFTAGNGCDSVVNVSLTLLPEATNNIVDDFCENDTYTLPDGSTTGTGGNFGPYTFTAGNGCDSVVNVTLTMLPEVTNNITDDFCENTTYTLPDGSTTSTGGNFGPYTFTAANGCDSIVNVSLTLLPEATNDIIDDFCENDAYLLPDGTSTSVGGNFGPYTFTAANGCDSIVNVSLTMLPEAQNNIVDQFCENTTYTLPDGSTTTSGGAYGPFTFTAANGCDSVVTVDLTEVPEVINNITDNFCENDTYTLPDGSTTTTGGNYGPFTFTAGNGCDSIVNVSLTMLPESTNNIVDDFCENTTYTLPDGSTTAVGGNFGPYTFTGVNGCDSIVNVSLTLLPEAMNDIVDDFCENTSYTLPDGSTTSMGGNFGPYTFTAANGCDSVVTVSLTLLPEVTNNIVDDFCENDVYTLPDGSTTAVGGNFGPFTFTASNGCDSVVNVSLTLLPAVTNAITDDFCENTTYTLPDGSTTTTGGNYGPYVFTAANGCDSTVNVSLTLLPEVTNNIVDDFCENTTYTLPDGSTTTTGGNFGPYTFTASNGCDSVVNVSLTMLPEVTNNIVDEFCENTTYTLPDGSTTGVGGNFGPYVFTGASGCDSTVNVSLTLLPEVTNNIVDDFCENTTYTLPDGSTTGTGGNFGPYTFTAGNGCDSIVNVSLTLLPEVTNNIVDEFCENTTYTLPDGSTTSTGGSFGPYTFTAGNGCDSIVNVSLTLLPEATNDIVDDFCENDTYTLPDGSTTSTGGNFGPYTFTAANGCDSIVTVVLTLIPVMQNDITDQFCENTSYTLPDGSTATTGGVYGPFTFTGANGCDSIVTVDLTEVPEVTNDIVDSFCENDTYTLPDGSTTSVGGNFGPYTFTAGNGCDSVVTVALTLIPEVVNNIVDDFCENDMYTLPDGSTTSVGGSFGPYTFTGSNGCDSVVNVSLTLMSVVTNDIIDDFCENDTYTLPDGSTTNVGGTFGPFTFTGSNGCDSIVNVSLTLLPESVNNIVDDFCENGTYTLPDGSTTNTGGNFGPYTFTASNGCDSIVNVSLTEIPAVINDITDSFCEGSDYTLPDGSTTNTGGTYGPYTFIAANGCDSIVTLDLTEVTAIINDIFDSFCEDTDYTLPDGSTTNVGGTYGPYTFVAGSGCDSIVTVDLTEVPAIINNLVDSFCEGTDYTLPDGSATNAGGNYGPFTFVAGNGCDSLVNVDLTEIAIVQNDIMDTFCEGSDYILPDGSTTTVGGVFGPYTFTGASGCDSIVTVDLTAIAPLQNDIVDSFCEGSDYILPDGSTTTVGGLFGPYTFIASNGCDSLVTVDLTGIMPVQNDIADAFCEGTDYVLPDGSITTVGGVFGPFTFIAGNGCDSIVTVDLTGIAPVQNDLVESFCEGTDYILPDGSVTTVGGFFGPYTFVAGNGCDSIVTLDLTEVTAIQNDIVDTFCDGSDYTLPDGSTTTAGGFFGPYTFVSGNGCDSIVTLDLSGIPPVQNDIVDSFCQGSQYTLPDGSTTGVGGVFGPYTFIANSGCDSIVTVDLSVTDAVTGDETYSGCSGDGYSVIVNGTIYNENNPNGTETLVSGTGCDSIVTIDLDFAPAPVASITPSGPFCASESSQTLSATPAGGVWSGSVSSNQFDPGTLGPGQHEVIYTATAGACSDADTIQIVVFQEVIITCAEVTPASGPGNADGVGSVTVSSGTPVYDIEWAGPVAGTAILNANGTRDITGLSPGDYSVTVTDANDCSAVCAFTITFTPTCTIPVDSVSILGVSCPGNSDGAVQIHVSMGTTPYMYSFNGGPFQSSNVFSGLDPGTWTVSVRDASGCTGSTQINIPVGTPPALSLVSVSPASCGQANGTIAVTATGGTAPYEYSRGGPYQPLGIFNGLASGTYNIYVLDDNGCGDTLQVNVGEDGAPVIDDILIVDPTCGQSNGSITILASGDAAPFEYAVTGVFLSTNVFNNLPAASYTVQVRDTNDCIVSQVVVLNNVGGPVIDAVDITPATCGLSDGSIEIIASGGTGALQYRIDNGAWTANIIYTNLASGNHTIEVRDAAGCVTSQVVVVPTTDGPVISNVTTVQTTCGQDNGRLTIVASGGAGSLTYCVSAGNCQDDDHIFTDLQPGTYNITVTDENGCSAQTTAVINGSVGPGIMAFPGDEQCNMSDGLVILSGSGGTPPYTYSFDGRPYSTNDFYSGLSAGIYDICVRDAAGCITCDEVFIDNDPPPVIDSIVVTPATCTQNVGTITVYASSLSTPLSYSVNGTFYQSSNVFTGLAPGNYTVHVEDAFDCFTTRPVTIGPNTTPSIDNIAVTAAECTMPGSLTVTSSGGNGAHQYSLDNVTFQSSPVFTGLGAGNYIIYIKDALDCSDQAPASIPGPPLDMTSLTETICEGDTYTLGSQVFDMTGVYPVTFTGSDGCDSIVTLNLTVQPCCTPVFDSLSAVICDGDAYPLNGTDYTTPGTHLDTIPGGAANGCDSIIVLDLSVLQTWNTSDQAGICEGEVYDWNGQQFTQTGLYSDTLTSIQNGCDSILTLDLTVHPLPQADAGADQTLTCGVTQVMLNGSGTGTPHWSGPGVQTPDAFQTNANAPGTYFLTVESAQGCFAVDSVEVFNDPDFPVANAGPNRFLTCEDSVVTIQGSGNTPGLLLTWSGPGIQSGQEHNASQIVSIPGAYVLIVEDTLQNCVSPPDTVFVTDIRVDLLANIVASGDLNCINTSVQLSASGSSSGGNIVYIWVNPLDQVSLDVSSIMATMPGLYRLFVVDSLSMCQDVDSHVVLDLVVFPPADAGLDTIIDCNVGFINLEANVNLQQAGLYFSWSGPAGGIVTNPNNRIITIIAPGVYTVTVRDTANGCESTDVVTVTDSRDAPHADAGPTQFINCSDDTAILDASLSSTGDEFLYTWNGPGVTNVHDIQIEVDLPGWYRLDVMNMETGCEASDSTEVKMADFLSGAEIVSIDPKCLGDNSGQIIITAPIGGVPPFLYSLDGILFQSSPVFTGLSAGSHSIVIRDNVNCEWDTTIIVNEGIELMLNLGPDIEIDFGDTTILTATVVPPGILDSIVWSPAGYLSCTHCPEPVFTANQQNNVVIIATAYAGTCVDSDELLVIVDTEFDIFVPNIFSPNGDNINDFVTAFADVEVVEIVEFEIFDRWGELVFRKQNFPLNQPQLGWDGSFKGEVMNPGVFVYKLKVLLIDGSEMVLGGDITLIK